MPAASRFKPIFRFALACLVLLALPGCAGFSGLIGEPVEITFSYLEGAANYEALAQAFQEEHRNITVKLDPIPLANDPLRRLAERVEEADVIRFPSMYVSGEIAGAFLPLDTFVTTDQNFPQNDLFPFTLDGLKVGGKLIAVPAGLNPYVMYYNPLKLDAAGVNPPPPNWVLEEFMNIAMAVNNPDEALRGTEQFTYGFCSHPNNFDPVMFAYVFGGGVLDNPYQPSMPTLNSVENVAALAWYASLQRDFNIVPPAVSPRDVGMFIVRGNCGFWTDWLDRSTYGAYLQPDMPMTMIPLPNYAEPFGVAALDGYSILARSEHPDEAWKWVRFLLDQPAASGYLIPPRLSHIESQEYADLAAPDTLGVARSLSSNTIVLGFEMYSDPRLGAVLELFTEATFKVLSGDMDAQTALDAAQREAEARFGR